jgi:hypothetical protein
MLPSNLDYAALSVKPFGLDWAAEAHQDAVNSLEEARQTALVFSARCQQTLRRYHKRKIRGRTLEVGDLVLGEHNRPRASTSSLRLGKDRTRLRR